MTTDKPSLIPHTEQTGGSKGINNLYRSLHGLEETADSIASIATNELDDTRRMKRIGEQLREQHRAYQQQQARELYDEFFSERPSMQVQRRAYQQHQAWRLNDPFSEETQMLVQSIKAKDLASRLQNLSGKGWKMLGFAQRVGISEQERTDLLASLQRIPLPIKNSVINQLKHLPQIQDLREAASDLKMFEMGYLALQQGQRQGGRITQGFLDGYTTHILSPAEKAYENALDATRQAFKAYKDALDTTNQAYKTRLIFTARQFKEYFKEQLNPSGAD